jgi:hypothetical protein
MPLPHLPGFAIPFSAMSVPKMRRAVVSRYGFLRVAVSLLGLFGCVDSGKTPVGQSTFVDKDWLTAAVAAQLDASGRFPSVVPAADDAPALSKQRAAALADAFLKTFGSSGSIIWSEDAGVTVDGTKARQCDRLDFVESAYDAVPSGQNEWFRNAWGPQWVVRFCQQSTTPIVELTVAANASGVQITESGTLPAGAYSAIFVAHGIPQKITRSRSIEDAAEAISRANRTGRISQLPRLIGIGAGIAPFRTSFLFEQTDAGGGRTIATAVGLTRAAITVRPGRGASVEIDTLFDVSASGALVPVALRRRSNAVSKADLRAVFLAPGGAQ